MREILLRLPRDTVSDYMHKYYSPRRYYLHNKVGGDGWSVTQGSDMSKLCVDNDDFDESIITFLLLSKC